LSPADVDAAPAVVAAEAAAKAKVVEDTNANSGFFNEFTKVAPLALIFFCVLFNYTILRDTKDVLIVTAKNSGAELIPFLKTYGTLPSAISFTVLYSALCNRFAQPTVFRGIVTGFLAFFALFAFVLYPNQAVLHPHAFCDKVIMSAPFLTVPIAIIRNWTFSLFYIMAEMWGSVVASLLFWGFANSIMSVKEAKKFYPLFGLFANVALIFSGQFVRTVAGMRAGMVGGDPWASSLKVLISGVVASGGVLLASYEFMQRKVVNNPVLCDPNAQPPPKKKKGGLSMGDSFKQLAASPYIRDLATLVISYGMAINIIEVSWKAALKKRFSNPTDYAQFMGGFSSATGAVTLVMMLLGQQIFKRFGWGVAAIIPPLTMLATGCTFFSLLLFPAAWAPVSAYFGASPLTLAVFVGAAQNILSKSSKYSLFDPCKEMAYIPLDPEEKTKGKAAVDVIGNPLGKSGGSLLQQGLILSLGSLAASTPYLAGVLFFVVAAWLKASRSLAGQFEKKMFKLESAAEANVAAVAAANAEKDFPKSTSGF